MKPKKEAAATEKATRQQAAKMKKAENERIRKAKADMTVKVIQQNQAVDQLVKDIEKTMITCKDIGAAYDGQRELVARTNMMLRVMASAIGMLQTNKLKLWMIDEKAIEEAER